MKVARLRSSAAKTLAIGWSGEMAMKLAPNSVSGRVVKTSISFGPDSAASALAKRMRSPSD
jgi:hypothetical protein